MREPVTFEPRAGVSWIRPCSDWIAVSFVTRRTQKYIQYRRFVRDDRQSGKAWPASMVRRVARILRPAWRSLRSGTPEYWVSESPNF